MHLKKGWQKAIVAAVLLAAASVLAHLHVAAQVYYPIVRMTSPEGVIFTALQAETPQRQECGRANDRFIAPMRRLCKECKVLYARCARELDTMQAALASTAAPPFHIVDSPGLRLAIEGQAEVARASCEFIANDLRKRGFQRAVCLAPRK